MEREQVIKSLKRLKDNGECISQTLVLDEAIKLLEQTSVVKVIFHDGSVLDCARLDIYGNSLVADEYRHFNDYDIDHIEAGEV